MASTTTVSAESFEFRTRLAPGMGNAYELFHRAIPAELHAVMRDCGVVAWQIFLRGDVVTHRVVADRRALTEKLDPHPVNRAWQRQVAPYLLPGEHPDAPDHPGALIWEFSWPTR